MLKEKEARDKMEKEMVLNKITFPTSSVFSPRKRPAWLKLPKRNNNGDGMSRNVAIAKLPPDSKWSRLRRIRPQCNRRICEC